MDNKVKRFFVVACLISLFVVFSNEVQSQKYVKQVAAGLGDGSSWANASNDLQKMIDNSPSGGEVWVANGVYIPQYTAANCDHSVSTAWPSNRGVGTSPDNAFVLKPNVKVYGGFAGWETSLSQRDFVANETVLSGISPQTYHVVISAGEVGSACLDGFTITEGKATPTTAVNPITVNWQSIYQNQGGGIIVIASSPTLSNLVIKDNYAADGGGGIYFKDSPSSLTNVEIHENWAAKGGGGIYINESSPILNNVDIHDNHVGSPLSAGYGGGIYFDGINDSNFPMWKDVNIYDNGIDLANPRGVDGGGIYVYGSAFELSGVTIKNNNAAYVNFDGGHGGGIYIRDSYFSLFNATISGNKATPDGYGRGGGIYIDNTQNVFNVFCTLINVLLTDNTAEAGGAVYINSGIYNTMVNVTVSKNTDSKSDRQGIIYNTSIKNLCLNVYNSILWGNNTLETPSNNIQYYYSLVQNYPAQNNGLDGTDPNIKPNFVDAANGDYRLIKGSPCIDQGDNQYIVNVGKLHSPDLAGNPRYYNGRVDMGPYECQNIMPNKNGVLFVKQGGYGLKDGSCWADAYDDFANALQIANTMPSIREIWVADGIYYPNTNIGFVLPDNVKIYGGFPANADDYRSTSINSRPVFSTYSFLTQTILSGSIGGNTNNKSYHTVVALGNSYIDGFKVIGGNASGSGIDNINGKWVPQVIGGGIFASDYAELRNIEVRNNSGYYGGGIAVIDGCPHFENVFVLLNTANNNGGGIYCDRAALYAKYIYILANSANYGGGIYCSDDRNNTTPFMPVFENLNIQENQGFMGGGGIYNYHSIPLFHNALIFDNNGQNGAMIYNDISSTILFNHATITKTTISTSMEIVQGGTFMIENSIICLQNSPPFMGNNYVNNGTCHYLFIAPYQSGYSLNQPLPINFAVNTHDMISNLNQQIPLILPCGYNSGWFQTDITGNPRGSIPDYGAFEYGSNSPYFEPPLVPITPPDIKSINNNKKEETILSKEGTNWKLQTYPNPTASGQQVTVSLENGNLLYDNAVSLKLFSIEGSLLFSSNFSTGKFKIDVPQLAAGIYIMQLQTATKQTYTGKLVVE